MAYDNSARAASALETRTRVIDSARRSFLEKGYAPTTIRGVATAARVSPETVYKSFRSKAGLLKAVYDVTLAGDGEQVLMAHRPEFGDLRAAQDAATAASAYGALVSVLSARIGPLLGVVLSSRGADPDLAAFAATIDAERLTGASAVVGHWAMRGWLRPGLTVERASDQVWTLNSPAVASLLHERGWSSDDYGSWVAATLRATVLAPPDPAPG